MKEKELWMQKLKEKLEDYSEPMPASGWERLEKELVPPVEKKIYPFRRWRVAVAAAVLLAAVSSLSLYFLGTPVADEMRHMQTHALATIPDALPEARQPDLTGTTVAPLLRPATSKNRLAKAERRITEQGASSEQGAGIEQNQQKEELDSPVTIIENTPSEENAQSNGNAQPKEKEVVNAVEETKSKPRRPSKRDKLHIPSEKSVASQGKWSMGLSVGNSGGTSAELNSGVSGYMSRVSMVSVSNGMVNIPNDQTLVFNEGIPYLRQASKVVDIEHHQPISFGLSVRKNLSRGFSLETGLTYTLLSSDAKVSDSEKRIEQKLHYLGIPLRANWNFLDRKLVTLYVSGGGMVEKCIYGKLGSEKETVKPLQFSVSGAVGAQLNATKKVGIYVEPGVAYFFNDGSELQTIRKENPFNFNIQAGIRYTY